MDKSPVQQACQAGAEYSTREDAARCAEELIKATKSPHFVEMHRTFYGRGGRDAREATSRTYYEVVDNSSRECGPGRIYNGFFSMEHESLARECAEALTSIAQMEGKTCKHPVEETYPLQYRAYRKPESNTGFFGALLAFFKGDSWYVIKTHSHSKK